MVGRESLQYSSVCSFITVKEAVTSSVLVCLFMSAGLLERLRADFRDTWRADQQRSRGGRAGASGFPARLRPSSKQWETLVQNLLPASQRGVTPKSCPWSLMVVVVGERFTTRARIFIKHSNNWINYTQFCALLASFEQKLKFMKRCLAET